MSGTLLRPPVAVTSMATKHNLEEFLLMKYSFELFHGDGYQWFVRCDDSTAPILSRHPNIAWKSLGPDLPQYPGREEFMKILGEKMNVLEDAWSSSHWSAVAWLDSDLVFTAPAIGDAFSADGDVVLTPHYLPAQSPLSTSSYGHYNAGFALEKTPGFHRWWATAYTADPRYGDQWCLTLAKDHFKVAEMSELANVGCWRFSSGLSPQGIPPKCLFFHLHMFWPLRSPIQWMNKSFALTCVRFLRDSPEPKHRELHDEILRRDSTGWYAASLLLS